MTIIFKPLIEDDARTVINWRYPDEYSIYNADADDLESEIAYFTDPENHYFGIRKTVFLFKKICIVMKRCN